MKTARNALVVGALAGGLALLTQQVPASAASVGSSTAGNPILEGKRQVVIAPEPGFESILAVDAKGRLNLTDAPDPEYGLFVLSPVSAGKWQIKTAKADPSGEPACMGIKNNGSASLTVVAAACDTSRPGQLFEIVEHGTTGDGDPAYAISSQSAYLQVANDSTLIAEELGDAPLRTTWGFADNGPANLPALD
jgi:hypothetical protein